MGNKVSKPARKLASSIGKEDVGQVTHTKVRLPSQELRTRFEQTGGSFKTSEGQPTTEGPEVIATPGSAALQQQPAQPGQPSVASDSGTRDGLDPQADRNFIDFILTLGRQIHSQSAGSEVARDDVAALKQLLNRKQLHEKGQTEVQLQLEASDLTVQRTMVHPRTVTAILHALKDQNAPVAEVSRDYQLDPRVMQDLDRFSVANHVVIIEEETKPDEIGPKKGQPRSRAATDPSLLDYDGEMSETVDKQRMEKLRSRLM